MQTFLNIAFHELFDLSVSKYYELNTHFKSGMDFTFVLLMEVQFRYQTQMRILKSSEQILISIKKIVLLRLYLQYMML